MKHEDKTGKLLRAGHRVLIPATISHLSPATGPFNCKVILDHRVDRVPTEFVINSSQVELHPDEEPAEEATETYPAGAGVLDSNTGFLHEQEARRKEKTDEINGTPQHVKDEIAARERNEKQAEADRLAKKQEEALTEERIAKEKAAAEAEALKTREEQLHSSENIADSPNGLGESKAGELQTKTPGLTEGKEKQIEAANKDAEGQPKK